MVISRSHTKSAGGRSGAVPTYLRLGRAGRSGRNPLRVAGRLGHGAQHLPRLGQQNRGGPRPLFVVAIDSGTRQPWDGGPKAPPGGGIIRNLTLTRDERTYAYTLREDTSTLYVAEGLR